MREEGFCTLANKFQLDGCAMVTNAMASLYAEHDRTTQKCAEQARCSICVVRSVLPVLMLPLPYSSPRGPFPTAPSLSSNSRIIYCLHATSTGKGSAVIAGVEENSGSRGKGSSRVPDAGIKTNEHQVGRGISPGGRMEGE
eukprot:scaffold235957_cov22-Tisochrysis_lutea.AAC.1